jgi:hypothetical protein
VGVRPYFHLSRPLSGPLSRPSISPYLSPLLAPISAGRMQVREGVHE